MSEDVKPEIIEKTQKVLGKHISKPVLSEKLLRKPPFRFLHDIVTAVIKDTGFLKGMYTESELISDNVKERDLKIAFLTKLIDAIKILTEIDLKVKPTKVIAGLEPSETNKLLQAIGYALDKKIDSTEYIKKISVKSKISDKTKKASKTVVKEDDQKDSHRNKKHESAITKPDKTKKKGNGSTRDNKSIEKLSKTKKERSKKDDKGDILSPSTTNDNKTKKSNTHYMDEEMVQKKVDFKNKESPNKVYTYSEEQHGNNQISGHDEFNKINTGINENFLVTSKNTEQQHNTDQEHHFKHDSQTGNNTILEEKDSQLEGNITQEIQKPKMDRPKSARPQSGDLKRNISKVSNIEEPTNQKINVPAHSMSLLRPPSVRPSSARPGAPRLRPDSSLPLSEIVPLGKINVIIENYNSKDVDEEETVVIHNAELEAEPIQKLLDIPEDKGHLVEQILEQIHDEDVVDHVKNKNEIDWESKGLHNKDIINREISQVRSQIQSLTKVANPLGKLMNYLHEDVESMLSELNMWINMKREVRKEIAKQKKSNEDSSKPVMLHLQELDDSIKKQEAEIIIIRSSILKNDLRIKDLLTK